MILNILLGVMAPAQLGLFLLFFILSVILGIRIAKKINQSKVLWGIIGFISTILVIVLTLRLQTLFFFGLFFFGEIVALVFLIILEKPWEKGLKQCPYCSGLIPIEAKKCKHCSEWLEKPD